jgi:hypothetical protein
LYEFGPYRLYPERRLLLQGQEAILLPAKALEILVVLVQRQGEVVSKDDLMQTVWPNVFVEEANISQNIFILRRALGEMEEAFNLSERSRARSFLDQLGNGRIDLIKNAPTDFSQRQERLRRENISLQRQWAQELAKSGPEVNPETISSIQSRLSAVRRQYEESVRDLKISSPEYASFLSLAPLALREVQRELASDVTVLSYFTTPGMTLAFVVTKNGFHVFRLPVSGAELSMAITSLLDFPVENDEPPPLDRCIPG